MFDLLSHAQMFALLAQVKTNQLSEYLGSVGVEGGQGDADNLFGSHDDHGQLGVSSGAGDIDDKYFSTGNIYVSSRASCVGGKDVLSCCWLTPSRTVHHIRPARQVCHTANAQVVSLSQHVVVAEH